MKDALWMCSEDQPSSEHSVTAAFEIYFNYCSFPSNFPFCFRFELYLLVYVRPYAFLPLPYLVLLPYLSSLPTLGTYLLYVSRVILLLHNLIIAVFLSHEITKPSVRKYNNSQTTKRALVSKRCPEAVQLVTRSLIGEKLPIWCSASFASPWSTAQRPPANTNNSTRAFQCQHDAL